VLLRLAARDDAAAKRIVRALGELAAAREAALLIDGNPTLAARAGADGVHVAGIGDALSEAIAQMKPERIVGCGGLRLRDEAMTAGEAGVDYVMFGDAGRDGRTPPFAETLERTAWWAEIFNIPCVACSPDLGGVAPLAAAGADFVALGDCVWTDARGIASAIREAQAALAIPAGATG
jgi:thiamine-phosphate pyrophosphorylase